jgi:hypothetical protein
MLQVGAGTGLLYLLRWFWWRITAWCEIAAMISSFGVSLIFLALHRHGIQIGTHKQLFLTVLCTTLCWLTVAYVGPQTDPETLVRFYRKVHPAGPGWRKVREMAGISREEAAQWSQADNIPLSLLGWLSGTSVIWSGLFTVGNVLYGRWNYALALGAVFLVSGTALVRVTRRLWQ